MSDFGDPSRAFLASSLLAGDTSTYTHGTWALLGQIQGDKAWHEEQARESRIQRCNLQMQAGRGISLTSRSRVQFQRAAGSRKDGAAAAAPAPALPRRPRFLTDAWALGIGIGMSETLWTLDVFARLLCQAR
jgi:hypothetical protein